MTFYIVSYKGRAAIVSSIIGREDAKRKARRWLGGDMDSFTVTPITNSSEITDVIVVAQ